MSEFEDKLNELLNDPGQMERIAGIAKSLMGGEAPPEPAPDTGSDEGLLKKISGLMKSSEAKTSNDKKLLEAMRPYLSEKRRSKMDKAMKIAKLASIASIAAQFGGDDDGNVYTIPRKFRQTRKGRRAQGAKSQTAAPAAETCAEKAAEPNAAFRRLAVTAHPGKVRRARDGGSAFDTHPLSHVP